MERYNLDAPFDDTCHLELNEDLLCTVPLTSIDSIRSHLNNDHTPNESQFLAPPAFSTQPSRHGRYHPNSAYIYGKAQNTLERLAVESSKYDEKFGQARRQNIYYPFSDRGEWELGKFLCENMNKVRMVCWRALLVDGFLASRSTVALDEYITLHPVYLLWRDALDVTQMIFDNPILQQHMCLDPHEVYTEHGDQEYYGEWMSSREAFRIRNHLPVGATIVPIILASDKIPVTRQTGGLEMHPSKNLLISPRDAMHSQPGYQDRFRVFYVTMQCDGDTTSRRRFLSLAMREGIR